MKNVRVAAIQMNALCGKPLDNLSRHEALARRAAGRGAELICFPELSVTGHYADKAVWAHSEAVPGGPSCRRVEKLASELDVVICAGVAERRDNLCYNTQFLMGPGGYIGKYSKSHASRDEHFYFRVGSEFPVWDIGKCKVGLQVCYDIAFPEVARILALKGAEVVLSPHAARCGQTEPREEPKRIREQTAFFEKIGWARSYDNGIFMVMCNQAGDAGGHLGLDVVHGGGMAVTAPGGAAIAKSKSRKFSEEVLVASLDAKRFEDNRCATCHNLQTRRPGIYGTLTQTA